MSPAPAQLLAYFAGRTRHILRKCGYPPDLQDAAVRNILAQAEALSAEWAA